MRIAVSGQQPGTRPLARLVRLARLARAIFPGKHFEHSAEDSTSYGCQIFSAIEKSGLGTGRGRGQN